MVMWASVGVRGSNLCWKGLSPHPLPRWLWGWVHLRKTNITTQKKQLALYARVHRQVLINSNSFEWTYVRIFSQFYMV